MLYDVFCSLLSSLTNLIRLISSDCPFLLKLQLNLYKNMAEMNR